MSDEAPLVGFVRTPDGFVMHAENHRKLVLAAGTSKSMLALLVPAEPFDADAMFAMRDKP